ncbi:MULTISPECIES: hypothetical protein [unclassified Myroides]|uniref:hypothetical protein n=1 Tax=unclassified Myroides TaxID=2642485 RepID=UPI003D2F7429
MIFDLEIPNSRKLKERDIADLTLSEALFTIYDLDNNLILIWNDARITLNYKLDIGDSILDIFQMIDDIINKKEEFKTQFPSQSFFELWICEIIDNNIHIKWDGFKENYNNNIDDIIVLDVSLFVKVWMKLLQQLKSDLLEKGYNELNLEDFYLFEKLKQIN